MKHRVLLFTAAAILIGTYWSLSAAVADTLFLSRLAADGHAVVRWLPWVYVLVAASAVVGTWSFGAAQKRFGRRGVLVASPIALAVLTIALRLLLATNALPVRMALAVLADAGGLLSMMIFFSAAGDHFSTREGKRMYGRIGAGLPIGVLAGGALVAPLAAALGLANLVLVAGALLLGTAVVHAILDRRALASGEPVAAEPVAADPPTVQPYARWLAWLSFLTPVLYVCADLPMKWLVSTRPPAAMAHFFGGFYAAVGVAELVVQAAGARIIMSVLGMNDALLLFPVLVGGACAVLVAAPTLVAAATASFLRAVVGETIEAQARELHWLALPARLRHRLQPWASGALAPLGQGVAGLALATLAAFGWYRAAPLAGIATAVLIVIVVRRLAPLHVRALADALRFRLLDERAMGRLLREPAMRAVTRTLLASPDAAIAGVTRELLEDSADEIPSSGLAVIDLADPDRDGIVAAAASARRLVARGAERPHDLSERTSRALERMALVHRARDEAGAFLAPFLDDHLRLHWDLFLSLCAFDGHGGVIDRVRRNLWTSSHSEALDVLDALLPPSIAARALPLANRSSGVGSGFTPSTRDRLTECGPWLRRIARYGGGDADDRVLDDLARLRALPLFAGAAADLLAPVAERSEPLAIAPGEVLFEDAAPSDAAYVILDGEVGLSVHGVPLATLGAGECVGELGVLDDAPRSARAVAGTAGTVLRVPAAALRDALATEPALVDALLRSISARLRATQGTAAWDGAAGAMDRSTLLTNDYTDISELLTRTAFLRGVPLFRGVSAGYVAAVARLAGVVPVAAGATLFAAGDAGDAFYVVESGQLLVRLDDRRIATLGRGDFVGEMALLDGAPRSATVVVEESGRLLRIGASDFSNLVATTPAIGIELLRGLAARLRATTRDVLRARESSSGRA